MSEAAVHPKDFLYAGPKPFTEAGSLAEIFWHHDGPVVDKWLHYLPIYERYFSTFRQTNVRFLEIGVARGGSLAMWRKYFGDQATIYGIDVEPACAHLTGDAAQVRIGSQDDPDFLADVIKEMGGVDVVLDDGSHQSGHMLASLDALFPALAMPGIYMIEDLHCAYWPEFAGGYGRDDTIVAAAKTMIDDLHHWYHDQGKKIAATAGHLAGLHVYDSVLVLEKQEMTRPARARIRQGEIV